MTPKKLGVFRFSVELHMDSKCTARAMHQAMMHMTKFAQGIALSNSESDAPSIFIGTSTTHVGVPASDEAAV